MAKGHSRKILVQNRRARFNYHILSTLEAGIVLEGSEVKSLRRGEGSLNEAFAAEVEGELFLQQMFIPEYKEATRFNHVPRRARKLLLRRQEIKKLFGKIKRRGMTLVPLNLYLNKKGKIKVELGLAEGKGQIDKRETIKTQDWNREKERLLKRNVQRES